jgi:hypothetical protein
MTGPEIPSSCLGSPTFLERGSEGAGLPVAQCTSTRRRITFPARSAMGWTCPSRRATFVRRPCQHLQPPTLLPRPYHRVYTRSRVHGGSAQRGWVERIPLYPAALRAFVFFLSRRPPLLTPPFCVRVLFVISWGSPHSNSTLCQFRGGGCPYNKLKPRDDDVD